MSVKHVSDLKEKLQLQKDAGPEMCLQNSFERTTALGLEISPGGPGQISWAILLNKELEHMYR